MDLYFDVGYPEGHKELVEGKTFTLEPKLISISPNKGSIGGSLIIGELHGFGPMNKTGSTYWSENGGTLIDMRNG